MKESYFDYDIRGIVDLSWNVLPPPFDGGMIVNRVNVPGQHRGFGIARELIRQVLADADTEGVVLWLAINPYGNMTYEQLEAWYMRLGFEKFQEGWYRRPPKGCAEVCPGPSPYRRDSREPGDASPGGSIPRDLRVPGRSAPGS